MFLKQDIDETLNKYLFDLGITDEDEMITLLNGLDEIAEIGYTLYVNNSIKRTESNDYES